MTFDLTVLPALPPLFQRFTHVHCIRYIPLYLLRLNFTPLSYYCDHSLTPCPCLKNQTGNLLKVSRATSPASSKIT